MRERPQVEIVVSVHDEKRICRKRCAMLVGAFEGPDVPESVRQRIEPISPVSFDTLIKAEEISGFFKEYTLLHISDPENEILRRVIMMGLGDPKRFDIDAVRSIAARAARTLRKIRIPEILVYPSDFPGLPLRDVSRALIEGIVLGTYRPYVYRKKELERPDLTRLELVYNNRRDAARMETVIRESEICAQTCNATKDLVNEPADHLTPADLADYASALGKRDRFSVDIFDERRLEREGFGGILAVGKGSVHPPRLIRMEYGRKKGKIPSIALVGKGVTFDSGGISIKNAHRMHEMKYDMAGAAAVIGVMSAVARMKLPVHLIGMVPTAENLPSATAYRPGDVIKTWDGTMVEIINTDAEGRMIMADALAYACSFDPDLVIDVATLTGGVIVALGHMTSGLMCNNERLAKDLEIAGEIAMERIWRLPLYREYAVQLKSIVADLMNDGGRPASAVTAGLFLRQFVNRPWAHLDIAGTAWIDESTIQYFHRPYNPKRGATGVGVRMLTDYIRYVLLAIKRQKLTLRERLAYEESLLDEPVGTLTMPQGGW